MRRLFDLMISLLAQWFLTEQKCFKCFHCLSRKVEVVVHPCACGVSGTYSHCCESHQMEESYRWEHRWNFDKQEALMKMDFLFGSWNRLFSLFFCLFRERHTDEWRCREFKNFSPHTFWLCSWRDKVMTAEWLWRGLDLPSHCLYLNSAFYMHCLYCALTTCALKHLHEQLCSPSVHVETYSKDKTEKLDDATWLTPWLSNCG